MKKFCILSCLSILIVGCASSVPSSDTANSEEAQKILVATSFYPQTHFAEQVGGDLIEVRQIAAPGADPHSYEPTSKQIQQIFESDLFIFNGEGQDAYGDRIHDELNQKGNRVLKATEIVERLSYEKEEHVHHDEDEHEDEEDDHEEEHEDEEDDHGEEHDDHEGEHDDHGHGEWDPHVWLDPQRAVEIVQVIAKELAEIEPSLASQFQSNADAYIAELRTLDADMEGGLSNCALDAVVVSHDAYRYLAKRYGFYTFEIAGFSPSMEPSPARLAELSEIADKEGIKHVFFETHVSSALSDTLASEIGAGTLVLHSIAALTPEERSTEKTYIDLQLLNLKNLRTALQCS